MDPELEKYIADARKMGVSDDRIQAKLAEKGIQWTPEAHPSMAGGLARSALQGAAFNFGDELAGLGAAVVPGGQGYREARDEFRRNDEAFHKEHPKLAFAAELAGGLAVPGLGGAKVASKGLTVGKTLLRAGALGAGAGALAGAGTAREMSDVPANATLGGLLGGAMGVAIPGVVAGTRAVQPVRRAENRILGYINRSGGVPALTKRLQDFTRAGRGGEVVLADLSVPLQQGADFAANANEAAAEKIGRIAFGRQADASERILNDVRSQVGNPHAEQIVDDLADATRKWADSPAGFRGLREANPVIVPQDAKKFGELLNSSGVKGPWEQAKEVGLIGPMPDEGPISFEVLQNTKERLDNAVSSAFSRGMGDLGRRLAAARDALVGEMKQSVPNYQKVAAEYGRRKGLEQAVELGVDAFRTTDSRGLAKTVSSLSQPELAKMREGMASEFIKQLRNAQTNRNLAKQLVDASPAMQDKLKTVFGSPQAFNEFMEKMGVEREMSRLLGALANSKTAARLAARDATDELLEVALDVPSAVIAPWSAMSRLAAAGRRTISRPIARKTAERVGEVLTTQGDKNIASFLQQLQTSPPRPLAGRVAGGAVPGFLGAQLGGLLGD